MKKRNLFFILAVLSGVLASYVFNHWTQSNAQSAAALTPSPSPAAVTTPEEGAPAPAPTLSSATPAPLAATPVALSTDDLTLKSDNVVLNFRQQGACITGNALPQFKSSLSEDATPVSLWRSYWPCQAFDARIGDTGLKVDPAEGSTRLSQLDSEATRVDSKTLRFVQKAQGLELTRTYSLTDPEKYRGSFEFTVKNISEKPVDTTVGFETGAWSEHKGQLDFLSREKYDRTQAFWASSKTVQRQFLSFEDSPNAEADLLLSNPGETLQWFGVESHYFTAAVLPKEPLPVRFRLSRTSLNLSKDANSPIDATWYQAWADMPIKLNPGETRTFKFDLYMGPKNPVLLEQFPDQDFKRAVDYGFFRIVAMPIHLLMEYLHKLLGNWGLAIIGVTIVLNILMFPLFRTSYISMKNMGKIQPQLAQMREKFKDNPVKMNEESMRIMRESGTNPFMGCLPILLQMPVFFGLNSVLMSTFSLRQAPFYGWIHDLAASDPYFVLPVIMTLTMYLSQFLMPAPPSQDKNQLIMMRVMPLMFSVFMIFYPSGLAIYVISNSVLNIVRTLWFKKRYA